MKRPQYSPLSNVATSGALEASGAAPVGVDEAEAVANGGVSGATDELDVDGDVPPRVLLFVAVRLERDGPAVVGRVERRRLDGTAHADAPGVGVAFHRE